MLIILAIKSAILKYTRLVVLYFPRGGMTLAANYVRKSRSGQPLHAVAGLGRRTASIRTPQYLSFGIKKQKIFRRIV